MVNNPPETADPGIGELVLSVLGRCVTEPGLGEPHRRWPHLAQLGFQWVVLTER